MRAAPHLELRLPLAGQHQLSIRNGLRLLQGCHLLLQLATLLGPLLTLPGNCRRLLTGHRQLLLQFCCSSCCLLMLLLGLLGRLLALRQAGL